MVTIMYLPGGFPTSAESDQHAAARYLSWSLPTTHMTCLPIFVVVTIWFKCLGFFSPMGFMYTVRGKIRDELAGEMVVLGYNASNVYKLIRVKYLWHTCICLT